MSLSCHLWVVPIPHNFLNTVGKTYDKKTGTTSGHGDILLWKRRAEKYLVEVSVWYTLYCKCV